MEERFYTSLLRRLNVRPDLTYNRIVEFASGTGRILRMLDGAGYRCVGIDLSPEMSSYTHRALSSLSTDVITADMVSNPLKTGGFAVALNTLSSISCLDGMNSITAHLRNASRLLCNRGVYVIDFLLGVPQRKNERWQIERGQEHYEVTWRIESISRGGDKFVERIEVRDGFGVFRSRSQTAIIRARDFGIAVSDAGFEVESWFRPFRSRALESRPSRGRVVAVLRKQA